MPNSIKYSLSTQTLALKEGNFWIGTNDVGKGPSSVSDYWNGIAPPTGGYTIYLNKATQGSSIYVAANDNELIFLTNRIGSQDFTTVEQCLSWYLTQGDKMVLNIDYPAISTNGLVLNLDAGFVSSYPRTGTNWYDLSGSNNGILQGPTFASTDGGSFVFDGTNDFVEWSAGGATTPFLNSWWNLASKTFEMWINFPNPDGYQPLFTTTSISDESYGGYTVINSRLGINGATDTGAPNQPNLQPNRWYHVVWVSTNDTSHVLYLNGSYIGSNNYFLAGTNLAPDWKVHLMRDDYYGEYSQGSVPILRLYDRKLSETEAFQNYFSMISRFYTFPNIIQSGLVLHLDASLTPITTWVDLSGSGNNATLSGGAVFNSSGGGGIVFDGTNDYCSTSLRRNFTAMTIQVWFYGDGNQNRSDGVVVNRTSVADATGLLLNVNYNKSLGYMWNGAINTYTWDSGLVLNYFGWHFMSISISPTIAVAFLNGSTASNSVSHLSTSITSLVIGSDFPQDSYIQGRISSVYIYDRALSNEEVLQNYNSTLDRYSSFQKFISYQVWGNDCQTYKIFLISGEFTVGNTVYSNDGFALFSNRTFTQEDLSQIFDYNFTNTGIVTNSLGVITSINVPIFGCDGSYGGSD